jgi:hypothetical protein
MKPYCIGSEGEWSIYGINSVMRVSKYEKGGHFDLHRDGAFV